MRGRWIVGPVLFAAAVGVAADEARAQEACAVPEDVPELVYLDVFLNLLDEGFPMPEPACDRLTKTVLSTCHRTVSAAARCWKGVGKGMLKGGKLTCREQGVFEQDCLAFIVAQLEGLKSAVAASEADGHAACDAGAPVFRDYCLFGAP